MKLIRSKAQLGSKLVEVFRNQDNPSEYYLSQTSLGAILNKSYMSVTRFLESKWLKARQGEDCLDTRKYEGVVNNESNLPLTVKVITTELATKYIYYHALKGNDLADTVLMALTEESLKIRAMVAFEPVSENVATQLDRTNEVLATYERKMAKAAHMNFQYACYHLRFNPATVHDYLTSVVFGLTAQQARELDLPAFSDPVWSDPSVGINRHIDPLLLKVYRDTKSKAMSYRKGDFIARVDRAFQEVTADIPLG